VDDFFYFIFEKRKCFVCIFIHFLDSQGKILWTAYISTQFSQTQKWHGQITLENWPE